MHTPSIYCIHCMHATHVPLFTAQCVSAAQYLYVVVVTLIQQILFSPTTTVMETQLSQESTNSEKDASELIIGITCNTARDKKHATVIPGPNRRLLQPSGLQYFYRRVSCTGEVLIEEYCYCRKLLGNNVEDAHKHWHVVMAQVTIDPVIKACALSFSVISTPETTEYLQKHWNDLWLQMVDDRRDTVRGTPDYQMSRFMVQYALSWAMRSQDLDKALTKVRTCYNDMKKDNLDNFFLAPYYTVTIGRWTFEANEHNLSDGVIAEVLQYAAETLRLIATLEEDWARIDAFGAKISALNLLLRVANYLYRQLLHFTDSFKDLYLRIQHLYEEISEELNQNCFRVVLYDQAWFHSVSATYYQLASNTATTQEEKERMNALSQRSIAQAARLYDINGRWWRSCQEAERADSPDLIREYAKHGRSAPPV